MATSQVCRQVGVHVSLAAECGTPTSFVLAGKLVSMLSWEYPSLQCQEPVQAVGQQDLQGLLQTCSASFSRWFMAHLPPLLARHPAAAVFARPLDHFGSDQVCASTLLPAFLDPCSPPGVDFALPLLAQPVEPFWPGPKWECSPV